jgi:hypothetical protein
MDMKNPSPAIESLENAKGEASAEAINRTQGDVLLVSATNHVRRIPVPTNDPNDPLNFNKWRKLGIVICCCWFCMFYVPSSDRVCRTLTERSYLLYPLVVWNWHVHEYTVSDVHT